jgi:CheY-like chemotaxis protein
MEKREGVPPRLAAAMTDGRGGDAARHRPRHELMSLRADRPIEILLVEDDEADVAMIREALSTAKPSIRLEVINDGSEVMPYLRGEGDHVGATRPDLILLDLNLPGRHGRDVLADIKGDPDLRRIPVVVLTVSGTEQDVALAYDLHANAYVTKPADLGSFVETIRKIDEFFIAVVRLPPA